MIYRGARYRSRPYFGRDYGIGIRTDFGDNKLWFIEEKYDDIQGICGEPWGKGSHQ